MQQSTGSMLWTVVVAVGLTGGSLSPPASASWDVEARKIRMVERFGFSAADPGVSTRIAEAHAVLGLNVEEADDGITVVVETTGAPEVRSVIFEGRRRLVLDLFDTLDVSSGGPWDLGADSPIRGVRHSQFQIQPEYISRVVCDLAPGIEPNLVVDGDRLTIHVPYEATEAAPVSVAMAPAPVYAEESLAAPEAPVVLDALQVDDMPAAPSAEAFATAADAPPVPPASAPDETGDAPVPWWMATELETAPAGVEPAPISEEARPAAVSPSAIVEEPLPVLPVRDAEPTMAVPDEVDTLPAIDATPPPAEDLPIPALAEPAEDAAVEAVAVAEAIEVPAVEPAPVPVAEPMEALAAEPEPAPVVVQPAPVRYELAAADPMVEPLVEELAPTVEPDPVASLFDDAGDPEPARTDVEETIDTPSMPTLAAPATPAYEPVVVDEPGMTRPVETPIVAETEEPVMLAVAEPALFEEEAIEEPLFPIAPLAGTTGDPGSGSVPAADVLPVGRTAFEQTVTLTFRDADLNAVLDIIARKGRINILAGRDISGSVTVRLVEVPLDVALDAVLNVNGYGYIKTQNIYRIVPLSQIGGDEVETITESFELSYAKAEDLEETLKSFLTRNGAINTDDRTNLLIVTDVPQAVARIADLIPQMDRRVQQSLIEVVILDSVLTDGADLGVQWNLFQRDDRTPGAAGGTGFPFVSTGTMTGAGATSTIAQSLQDGLGVNLPSASSGGAGVQLRFGTLVGDFNISAFIEAQVVNSNARVLANPKLLTLDNTTANIDIIEEIPFQDITQTSSGGQLSNISFKEVGTKLKVKPHITNDGYVILEIEPEQSSQIAQTATGVPVVATRRAKTTLLVQDHQTIVLGGLRINRSTLTRTKVPGLGDVPAFKLLFRSTSSDETDTEILLFLTTHIIESPPIMPHERLVYEELANTPRNPQVQPHLWR